MTWHTETWGLGRTGFRTAQIYVTPPQQHLHTIIYNCVLWFHPALSHNSGSQTGHNMLNLCGGALQAKGHVCPWLCACLRALLQINIPILLQTRLRIFVSGVCLYLLLLITCLNWSYNAASHCLKPNSKTIKQSKELFTHSTNTSLHWHEEFLKIHFKVHESQREYQLALHSILSI